MIDFGFLPSKIDGSELIFGATQPPKNMPEEYSYQNYLPCVMDQGANPICVPCSISTYLNWKENLKTGNNEVDNKIDYFEIYGSKDNQGPGMTFKKAFYYLRHSGVKSRAGILKIEKYALIKNSNSLKQAILINGPCFGALPVYNWDSEFWNERGGESLQGYHAVSIVGYNTADFIIRNSWGLGFGSRGYTKLPIKDYNKLVENWTIIL